MNQNKLKSLLEISSARHQHVCPRQVLGVRMGMHAADVLALDLPQKDKRLFTFMESDGCALDGVSAATGCYVGRRTMQVLDFGKIAATFVDTQTGQAIRIIPHPDIRKAIYDYAGGQQDRWHQYLEAYQVMPVDQMLVVQPVQLTVSMKAIISREDARAICDSCGEEIFNDREIILGEKTLCRSCAGQAYYRSTVEELPLSNPERISTISKSNGRQKPIPIVTVIGKSGSGKTTILEKMVAEFKRRGHKLATIKHHSHAGFDIDVPGKDSWRFAQAGSDHVVIAAPDKIASYHKISQKISLDEITAGISGVDLILVEGYKQANKPSLEVVRGENSRELLGSREQRFALAADFPLDLGVPQFGLEDIELIVDLIEERYLGQS